MNTLLKSACIATMIALLSPIQTMADSDKAAVKRPSGICTMDINPCGNSSICTCDEGYRYDAKVGYCIIDNLSEATHKGFDKRSIKSSCSIQVPPNRACTRDLNPVGYPSYCDCSGIGEYDQRLGQCVLALF